MGTEDRTSVGIGVVGFPYVRDEYFAVFRHWPEPDAIRFLLPRRWTAKGGKVVYQAPDDSRVTAVRAYFDRYHHDVPVIGGLMKGWMPSFPIWLWRNRAGIDVVYACSEPILLVTLYYALFTKLLRRKLVLFSWENISYKSKLRGLSYIVHVMLLRLNLWLADGLICGNSKSVGVHREYSAVPMSIVPMNGLDPERFRPNAGGGHYPELEMKTVYLYAGAIGYRKGIHVLLDAFKKILGDVPEAHLVIAGSGEYEKEIEERIDGLGLRKHVTRFPWLSHHELIRLMSVADVFVYPSIPHSGWEEQFGYSMAEASLMELPVVSTETGSIADVVRDGETGILVPPDDVGSLSDAMTKLGLDRDLRMTMGRAGRRFISESFSHASVARKMYDFMTTL